MADGDEWEGVSQVAAQLARKRGCACENMKSVSDESGGQVGSGGVLCKFFARGSSPSSWSLVCVHENCSKRRSTYMALGGFFMHPYSSRICMVGVQEHGMDWSFPCAAFG